VVGRLAHAFPFVSFLDRIGAPVNKGLEAAMLPNSGTGTPFEMRCLSPLSHQADLEE